MPKLSPNLLKKHQGRSKKKIRIQSLSRNDFGYDNHLATSPHISAHIQQANFELPNQRKTADLRHDNSNFVIKLNEHAAHSQFLSPNSDLAPLGIGMTPG